MRVIRIYYYYYYYPDPTSQVVMHKRGESLTLVERARSPVAIADTYKCCSLLLLSARVQDDEYYLLPLQQSQARGQFITKNLRPPPKKNKEGILDGCNAKVALNNLPRSDPSAFYSRNASVASNQSFLKKKRVMPGRTERNNLAL